MNFWNYSDAAAAFTGCEKSEKALYPISLNVDLWHSGIHFNSDKPVESPISTTLVAWQTGSYKEAEVNGKKEKESNTFFLTRNQIKFEGQELIFYMLYTHLLPASEYLFKKETKNSDSDVKVDYVEKVSSNEIENCSLKYSTLPFYKLLKVTLTKGKRLKVIGTNGFEGAEVFIKSSNFLIPNDKKDVSIQIQHQENLIVKRSYLSVSSDLPKTITTKKNIKIYNKKKNLIAEINPGTFYADGTGELENGKYLKMKLKGSDIIADSYAKNGLVYIPKTLNKCRLASNDNYIYVAKDSSDQTHEVHNFLKLYYPLDETTDNENILEVSKADITDIMEEYGFSSKLQTVLFYDSSKIFPIKNNCDSFYEYFVHDSKIVEAIALETTQYKEVTDKIKAKEISLKNSVKTYRRNYSEYEGEDTELPYKIKVDRTSNSIDSGKKTGHLYISQGTEVSVYIDVSELSETDFEIEYPAKLVNIPESSKEGVFLNNGDVPVKAIYCGQSFYIKDSGMFEQFKALKKGSASEIMSFVISEGKEYNVVIDKYMKYEISLEDDEQFNNKVQSEGFMLSPAAVLGLPDGEDNPYYDVCLFMEKYSKFTLNKSFLPAKTQLYILSKPKGTRIFLPNNTQITSISLNDTNSLFKVSISEITLLFEENYCCISEIAGKKRLNAKDGKWTFWFYDKRVDIDVNTMTFTYAPSFASSFGKSIDYSYLESILKAFFKNYSGVTGIDLTNEKNVHWEPKYKEGTKIIDYYRLTIKNIDKNWPYIVRKKEFYTVKDITAGSKKGEPYIIHTSTIIGFDIFDSQAKATPYLINYPGLFNEDKLILSQTKISEPKGYIKYTLESTPESYYSKAKPVNKDALKWDEDFSLFDSSNNLYENRRNLLNNKLEEKYLNDWKGRYFDLFLKHNKSDLEYFRDMAVVHPLEFDKDLFSDDSDIVKTLKNKVDLTYFKTFKEHTDIYSKIKDKFNNKQNNFCFYHPVKFLNKLDTWGLLEENPYNEKKYSELFTGNDAELVSCQLDPSQVVNDSPGVTPVSSSLKIITGFFNHDYAWYDKLTYKNKWEHYYHEGVDFGCIMDTPVKALRHLKVIAYGIQKNGDGVDSTFGKTVWLYNPDGNGIYLLAHLNKFPDDIFIGKDYYAGDIVAYTGRSGASEGVFNENAWQPHLHLSYYDEKYDNKKQLVFIEDGYVKYYNSKDANKILCALRNPFYHTSEPRKTNIPIKKE